VEASEVHMYDKHACDSAKTNNCYQLVKHVNTTAIFCFGLAPESEASRAQRWDGRRGEWRTICVRDGEVQGGAGLTAQGCCHLPPVTHSEQQPDVARPLREVPLVAPLTLHHGSHQSIFLHQELPQHSHAEMKLDISCLRRDPSLPANGSRYSHALLLDRFPRRELTVCQQAGEASKHGTQHTMLMVTSKSSRWKSTLP
jgi:hypothetical protein